MKPMTLNLSKMKKIAGDDRSSTFMHPDGHKMVIAHGAVSALQRKQLEKLPVQKFAEGTPDGPVDAPAQKPTEFDEMNAALNPFHTDPKQLEQAHEAAMASLPKSPEEQAAQKQAQIAPPPPVMPEPEAAPQQEQAPTPTGASVPLDLQAAYNQGQRAISEQQAVDSSKSKASEGIQQQAVVDSQKLYQDAQKNYNGFAKSQGDLLKDYAAGHIDPKRYVHSMGAGEKIATSIGLLLGGFSTPYTGQSNPAMDFLNKQIERDISAQAADMDRRKTLLGANQAMFHDNILAQNQTRINLNDIYGHEIQMAAAKLGTPQAKAAADAAHFKLAMESNGLLQQNAIRKTYLDALKPGSAASGDPEQAFKIRTQLMRINGQEQLAKDMEAKHVPGVGDASKEVPPDVMKELIARQDLQNKIEDLKAFAAKNSGSLDPSVINQGKAKAALVQDAYRRANNQGVFKESEKNFVGQIVAPDPTQFFEQYRAGKGYAEMGRDNLSTLNTIKSGYGLPTRQDVVANPNEGKTATNSQGQKIVMKNGRWVAYGG